MLCRRMVNVQYTCAAVRPL